MATQKQAQRLTLDELGKLHATQIAALEQTRAELAPLLIEARARGGRDATWARLAQRSGYAGPSSVRKVVEEARAKARRYEYD